MLGIDVKKNMKHQIDRIHPQTGADGVTERCREERPQVAY